MPNSTSPGSNETADDNEVNPFDADVERHKRAAASPTLPAEKKALAASDIERLEQLQQRGPELEKFANAIGLDRLCREMDDETLAILNAEVVEAEDTKQTHLWIGARESLTDYEDTLSPAEIKFFHRLLFDLFSVTLAGEMDRRQRENENKAGREIRGMLVEETERSKRLTKLAKWTAFRLRFPEQPGEEQSIAVGALWEQIAPLAEVSPVAANPEALQAFMQGSLNKILRHVRDHLRTMIETEGRRSELRVEEPASHLEEDRDEPFIERFPDEAHREPYQKLLVEQTMDKANLTQQEREIISLCVIEDCGQVEVAERLRISQSQVSKSLKKSLGKLSEIIESKRDVNPPASHSSLL